MHLSLKQHFSRFLNANPERLHFAAHSHHYWPDVTLDAHQQAWLDAAQYADDKWDHVFGTIVPEAQKHIASELSLDAHDSIVFAPNTHQFVVRLLSCLGPRPRIVTTDSEFHSFERQTRRLEEDGFATVIRVPAEPFATFGERLVDATKNGAQLVFFSHVFFNSGAVVPNLDGIVHALPLESMVVIDGYHGFGAVPTSLHRVGTRAFYVAGGYKYAMAGEGACFLHVPAMAQLLRPVNTGWFASFGALDERMNGRVAYSPGAARFLGATFDPTGLYRFNAVMRWRHEVNLTTSLNRAHAHALQRQFVDGLQTPKLNASQLVVPVSNPLRGQFLTFRTPDAKPISAALKLHHVATDSRDDRLRFGFAAYQDEKDVSMLLERVHAALG